MKLKSILASVSLCFGGTLLVLSSLLVQTTVDTRSEVLRDGGGKGWTKDVDNRYWDNYYGVQSAYALALVASILQIAAFAIVAVRDDWWHSWAGLHVFAILLAITACIVAIAYKVQTPPRDKFVNELDLVKDLKEDWHNAFNAGFWGITFIIIGAFDAMFSIGATAAVYLVKERKS